MKYLSFALHSVLAVVPAAAFLPSRRDPHELTQAIRRYRPASTALHESNRRDFLAATTGLTLSAATSKSASSAETSTQPLADLPMIRLRLPRGGLGREYVAINLKVDGKGPFAFMLDTGLTTEFITPHLKQSLGIRDSGRNKVSGLAAGGSTTANSLVELNELSLCCGEFADGASELPIKNLHAVITDFPQEHIDPAHDPVEGMLGMEMLSRFDVDFDFPKGRLRLWKPGTAVIPDDMVEIPAAVINETGLLGIRITTPNGKQPILGFLDCGSTFSAMNWRAAAYLGLPPEGDASYKKAAAVMAVGIDGRPIQLPIVSQQLDFAGDILRDKSGRPAGFAKPPSQWKAWDPVRIAVGDLPAFESILGDGVHPYKGPAALIGLDILAQRRVILQTGDPTSRKRDIFVSAK